MLHQLANVLRHTQAPLIESILSLQAGSFRQCAILHDKVVVSIQNRLIFALLHQHGLLHDIYASMGLLRASRVVIICLLMSNNIKGKLALMLLVD